MQQIFYRADLVRINMQARLTNTNNYPGPIVAQWPPGGFISDYFSLSVFFHFRHSDHARARLIANYPTLMMLLLAERPLAKRRAAPRWTWRENGETSPGAGTLGFLISFRARSPALFVAPFTSSDLLYSALLLFTNYGETFSSHKAFIYENSFNTKSI